MKRTSKIQKADIDLKQQIKKHPSKKKSLIKKHLTKYKKLEQKEHHTKHPTVKMEEKELSHIKKHRKPVSKLKESPKAKSFIEKRMHDFKEGKMHSRKTKTGPLVTNPKQAIAIALSESRKKGMKVSRKKQK